MDARKQLQNLLSQREALHLASQFAKDASKGRTEKIEDLTDEEAQKQCRMMEELEASEVIAIIYKVCNHFEVVDSTAQSNERDALIIGYCNKIFPSMKEVQEKPSLNSISWPDLLRLCIDLGTHFNKELLKEKKAMLSKSI